MDAEVLVVGAGPTGLTLACDLRQRGIDAQVIERRSGPSTTSRAFALHPRGMEILEDVGVGAEVAARAAVIGEVTNHAGGRPLTRLSLSRLARSGHPGVYMISQADIEEQLRTRLGQLGTQVRFGHELIGARLDDGHDGPDGHDSKDQGLIVTITHGGRDHDEQVSWLAGCDGAHSTVRRLADIAFLGNTLPETFLLADLDLTWPDGDAGISAFIHPDGIVGLFPLPGANVWRLIAQIEDDAAVPDDHDEVVRLAEDLLRRRTGLTGIAVDAARWSSRFRIHRRMAATYRNGRMLLAGDAAHVHSPFGGQGMNVGLGDASNLGWKLAQVIQGTAHGALLETYEPERRPVASQVVGLTTAATRFATGQRARTVRNHLLPFLARAGPGGGAIPITPPRALVERFAQLGVHYRNGPLAAPDGWRDRLTSLALSGPRPGDRAPDAAALRLPAQERTSLRELTRGGWALLQFGPPSSAHDEAVEVATRYLGDVALTLVRIVGARSVTNVDRWRVRAGGHGHPGEVLLVDHRGAVRSAHGSRSGEVMLVRPDGHLGWRSGWTSTSLDGWLTRALGRPDFAPSQRTRPGHR